MKLLNYLILIMFVTTCGGKSTIDTEQKENQQNGWGYTEVKQTYLQTIGDNLCLIADIEIMDIYAPPYEIADDRNEKLILVDLLKSSGFEEKRWGRGNWMEGPRIVSYTLSNDQCECQVHKMYYGNDGSIPSKVTERITCKSLAQ